MASSGNALISLLAETDFVAKNQAFIDAANAIAKAADENKVGDAEALKAVSLGDKTVGETLEEGKPEAAVAKIVEGRIGAFFKEIVLLDQESVFEAKKSVKQVLDAAGTTVTRFARFEV